MHQSFCPAQQMTQQLDNPHLPSQLRKIMKSHTLWFYKLRKFYKFYKLRPANKSRYRSDETNVFDLHPGVQKVITVLFEDF